MRQSSFEGLTYLKTHSSIHSRSKTWLLGVLTKSISSMHRWREVWSQYHCYIIPEFLGNALVWHNKSNLQVCDGATVGLAALTRLSSLPIVSIYSLFKVRMRVSKITWAIWQTFTWWGSPWSVLRRISLTDYSGCSGNCIRESIQRDAEPIQVRDNGLDCSGFSRRGEQQGGLGGTEEEQFHLRKVSKFLIGYLLCHTRCEKTKSNKQRLHDGFNLKDKVGCCLKKWLFGVWLINVWWRKLQMTKLGLVNRP